MLAPASQVDLQANSYAQRWWILAACCVVAFAQLAEPDLWIIGFDIPASAFGTAWDEYRFFANLGVMLFIAFQLIGGVLGDLYGRRRILLIGVIGSIVCNLFSFLAWNVESLIVMRGLVGIFGALAFPLALAIIRLTFTEIEERKLALVIYTFAVGAGTLASLLGIPIESALGWRWALALPILAGVIGLNLARRYLPESTAPEGVGRAEAIAAAAWALVTLTLLFGLSIAQVSGTWFNPLTLTAVGLGLTGLLVIFIWARRTARRGIFGEVKGVPRYLLSLMLLITATLSFALSAYVLQLYQFFATVNQMHGFVAGMALSPILLGNLFTIRWAAKFTISQPRHISVGTGIAMIVAAMWLTSLARPNFPYLLMVPLMVLFGLGFLIASAAWTNFFFAVLPGDLTGLAAGVNRAAGLVGGSLSGVILSTVIVFTGKLSFQQRMADLGLDEAQQALAFEALEFMLRNGLSADDVQQPAALIALGLLSAYREAYSVAISSALFTAGAGVLAVGLVAWLWLRRYGSAYKLTEA
ncbi:MAG: MFS transporter [Oscillochloridaceae bacterium umkhey_bin13]